MNSISARLHEIYSLEELSAGNSSVHQLSTMVKLTVTIVYIVCVASFRIDNVSSMAVYVFYPALMLPLAEIPVKMMLRRLMIAMPFCLFAGISNLIFAGAEEFFSVILKTVLCVAAVLILIAVTPFVKLTRQLGRMHVPDIFVNLIEMIYRYIESIGQEASNMYIAYKLRNPGARGIELRHMGSFTGQLLLRSWDRAERVYNAMKCRGYNTRYSVKEKEKNRAVDWIFLITACGACVVFRFVNFAAIVEGIL